MKCSVKLMTSSLAVAAFLLPWSCDGAQGESTSPARPNIALARPYTLQPKPNYKLCTGPGDDTQLTDGIYTTGYFWTQASTVGWRNSFPAIITVDLGKVQSISGASFNTAAGKAGVHWPVTVAVAVSDDGRTWFAAGDLVGDAAPDTAPPTETYGIHRYTATGWQTRGRYVRFMAGQSPYCFVDEVEVFEGEPKWLAAGRTGAPLTDGREIHDQLFMRPLVAASVKRRLNADLNAVETSLVSAGAPTTTVKDYRHRIAALAQPRSDQQSIIPLGPLHAEILALHATALRKRGFAGISAWKSNRWAPLHPLDAPNQPPVGPCNLSVTMMRGEVRAETFNLLNAGDTPVTVQIAVEGLPGGTPPPYLSIRNVLFTDTRQGIPIAAALPPAPRVDGAWRITLPAGCTRQVWLSFERPTAEIPTGRHEATVVVQRPSDTALRIPLVFHLYGLDFPSSPSLALGGWDYTNGGGAYYRAPGNLASLLALMRDHYVNTPWATRAVAPQGARFDREGHLVNRRELDFTAWDEWVQRWHWAKHYYVFLSVGERFEGEPMGTARFNRMVGEWFSAWADHVRAHNLRTDQVGILLVDEPHSHAQDSIIVDWAKAIRLANTGIRIFEDPTYRNPADGREEMFALCDVLCPNTPMMVQQGAAFRDFYARQRQQGRTLWLYSCSGPAKTLDPCAYHRAQMWWALRTGARGSFYWALGCGGGIGDSWRAYAQTGREYAPFFVGQRDVTDGKHMEAIREGVQDYEYFAILDRRISELTAGGTETPLLKKARQLLTSGPLRVTDTIKTAATWWSHDVDHTTMDAVRIEALDVLDRLPRLQSAEQVGHVAP